MQQVFSIWREQASFSSLKVVALSIIKRWMQVWSDKPFLLLLMFPLFYICSDSYFVQNFNLFGLLIPLMPFFVSIDVFFSRMSVGPKTIEYFTTVFTHALLKIVLFIVCASILYYGADFFRETQLRYIFLCTIYTFVATWFVTAAYDKKGFFSCLYTAGVLTISYAPIIIVGALISYGLVMISTFILFFIAAIAGSGIVNFLGTVLLSSVKFLLVTLAISAASVMYIRVIHNYYDLLCD